MSELVLQDNNETKLPLGWAESSLEDVIIHMIGGDWGKSNSTKIPVDYVRVKVIRSTELKNWKTEKGKTAEYRLIKKSSLDKRRLHNGDILLEVSGGSTTFLVGRTVLITNEILSNFKEPIICSNFFRKITLHKEINPNFVSYFLLYKYYLGFTKTSKRQTVNIQNLNVPEYVSKLILKISPVEEQKRIVAKIEELFSLVENVEKNITRTIKQINKLMQKVIDDFTSQNGESGWKGYKLGAIADIKGGVTLGRKLNGKTINIPYLRVANVQDGFLDLRKIKEIEILENEKHKWLLKSGDILLTEGGDRDKLGRGTVWKDQIPNCIHQNHIFRVRLDQQEFDPDFISLILRSSKSKQHFQNIGKQSVNLASINKTQLSSVKCSIPKLKIQTARKETIQRTLDNLSMVHELCFKLDRQILLVKKKILSYVFEGKLVPQDPNDEPAKILLQKIKQEKERLEQKQKIIKAKSQKRRRKNVK